MIIAHERNVTANIFDSPGVKGAGIKKLIGEQEGWTDYVMRIIELDSEGYSPKHHHPWPHINYMLEGQGVLYIDGQEHPVEAGSYAYVPADSEHQFKNSGSGRFRFICIVPKEGHQ